MSMESAKAFVERMTTDEEFAKQVVEYKDKDARMAFAVEQGYDFTVEELKDAASQLSDDDLDSVAGGIPYGQCFSESICYHNGYQQVGG